MKKIMIALAAVAMVASAQAANVKWQVDGASDYKGWNVYIYSGTSASIQTILATVIEDSAAPAGWTDNLTYVTAGSGTINNRGKLLNQGTTDVNTEQTWTVVLLNGTSFANGVGYAVSQSYAVSDYAYSGSDTPTTMSFDSFTAGTLATKTTPPPGPEPVPEPTSGLLMLLGVAGLALRRRI